MAELRKFLFDNFVIEEKRKNKPEAVEPEPEILPAVEMQPEEEPEEKQEDVREADFEEIVPPEPDVKTFTEEEVAEKIKIAEQDAYERGFKTAQEGIENATAALLENINNRLMTLIAASAQAEENARARGFCAGPCRRGKTGSEPDRRKCGRYREKIYRREFQQF